jgi:hypothetical protein
MREWRFRCFSPFGWQPDMSDENLPVLVQNGDQSHWAFQAGFDDLDNILEFGWALDIKQPRVSNCVNAFRR